MCCALITSVPALISSSDLSLHDTYYVVARWHYALSLVAACVIFALVYLALDGWKAAYRRAFGIGHVVVTLLGFSLILAPSLMLEFIGMPQRDSDLETTFRLTNTISTVGYSLTLAGWVFFGLVLWGSINRPRPI
jgi:cytochrome c oxidase subunit 1